MIEKLALAHPLAPDARRQLAEGRDDVLHEIVADLNLAGVKCDADTVAQVLMATSSGRAA